MAVLLIEGFEDSRIASEVGISFSAGTTGTTISYQTGRWGGVCIRGHATSGTPRSTLTCVFPGGPVTTVQAGAGFLFIGNAYQNGQAFLQLNEGATIHVYARKNTTTGYLEIVRGDGTVLASTTLVPTMTSWNHFALAAVIADGTGGSATLWWNGVEVATVTGVDTRNGGTGAADRVVLQSSVMSATTGSTYAAFDDLYVADQMTFVGDCRVQMLRPNGVGATTEWTPSTAVANWTTVDDTSMTDFVGTPAAGVKDTYALADLTVGSGDVVALEGEFLVAKNDAGAAPATVREVYRGSDGTEVEAQVIDIASLSTTAVWRRGLIRPTDPAGAPWTIAAVNGLQAGVAAGA